MRLNKFISETGICSRREADALIEQGLVTVNGGVATLGTQVDEGDDVRVRGRPLGAKKKSTYIAYNKPVGVTCTTERHVRGNIIDTIGHRERIFPIGRLDKDSDGLILLTNDGDIVNEILRVENRHEKEYLVTVDRPVTDDSPARSTERTTPVTATPRAASTSRTTAAVYRAGSETGTARRTPLLLRGIWPRTTSGPPYALRDTRIVVDPRATVLA